MELINKNKIKILSLLTLTSLMFLVFVLPVVSFAQNDTKTTVNPSPNDTKTTVNPSPSPTQTKIKNPLGNQSPDIMAFIKNALIGALKIGIPVVALAIIYSGFLFVFALGNPEKLKKARDALLYSVIGAAILLGSWAIANLIVSTIGAL